MDDTAPLGGVTSEPNDQAGDVDANGDIVDELRDRLRRVILPADGLDPDELAAGIARLIRTGAELDEARR